MKRRVTTRGKASKGRRRKAAKSGPVPPTTRTTRRRSADVGLQQQLDEARRELHEAREQQTATSEVLKAISSSSGNLQPVFSAVLENAARICGAKFGILCRFKGGLFHPVASLDVSVLQDYLLDPILGIKDVRTDKRIDFIGGIRGTEELERLVNEGQAAVAFSLYPTTVKDLLRVSDAGGIMPPKSTWFEPKLRDGILSHNI